MSDKLNLSLPLTAPSVSRYHDQPMEMLPAALYTLVDLPDTELRDLQRSCTSDPEEDDDGNRLRLPPRSHFVNESLRAVLDYHLILGEEGGFDPIFFVVATSTDWRRTGVLLVTLNSNSECSTDSFYLKAQDSAASINDLQLGNSDWDETKETYSVASPVNGGQSDDREDDGTKHGNDEGPEPSLPDDAGSPESGPVPPTGPTPLGYYIGVYAIAGVDCPSLIRKLEPGVKVKKPQDFSCRLQAVLPPSCPDPVSEAMDHHNRRCVTNAWLHKFLFFVADTVTPDEDGIVLASLGGEVRAVKFPARATQRVPLAAKPATQDAVCTMAQGYRSWLPPEGPAVGVFRYNTGSEGWEKAPSLLDPKRSGRVTGEEILVLWPESEWTSKGLVRTPGSLSEAIQRWPETCYKERFRSKFLRKYFICVDNMDVKSQGVLLVKIEWDEQINGRSRGPSDIDLENKAESWRVEARRAHQILKGLMNGTVTWGDKNTDLTGGST